MARFRFSMPDVQRLKKNVRVLDVKIDRAIKASTDYHALEGTAHMKDNAPWTDRTGAARIGLHGVASKPSKDKYEIVFSHTVHYGIWLEIANSGRYQIIMPTVHREGDLFMQRMRGLLGKLR